MKSDPKGITEDPNKWFSSKKLTETRSGQTFWRGNSRTYGIHEAKDYEIS